jgi:hypothetical protein
VLDRNSELSGERRCGDDSGWVRVKTQPSTRAATRLPPSQTARRRTCSRLSEREPTIFNVLAKTFGANAYVVNPDVYGATTPIG